MPSLTQDIRFGSPLHKTILSACRARVKASRDQQGDLEKRVDEGAKRVNAFLPEGQAAGGRRRAGHLNLGPDRAEVAGHRNQGRPRQQHDPRPMPAAG